MYKVIAITSINARLFHTARVSAYAPAGAYGLIPPRFVLDLSVCAHTRGGAVKYGRLDAARGLRAYARRSCFEQTRWGDSV